MRYWLIGLLSVIALVLQSTVLARLPLMGVRPDLTLLLVVSVAVLGGPLEGAAAGAIAGGLQDLMHGRYLGISLVSKAATGYLAGLLERRLYRENPLVMAGVAGAATALHHLVYFLGLRLLGSDVNFLASVWYVALPLSLVHAVLSPLFCRPGWYQTVEHRLRQVVGG